MIGAFAKCGVSMSGKHLSHVGDVPSQRRVLCPWLCLSGPELRRFWLGVLPQSLSAREKARIVLQSSNAGLLFESVGLLITIISCADYVAQTYGFALEGSSLTWATSVYVVVFGSDFLLNWWAAPPGARTSYLLSWTSLVDLITTVPMIVELVFSAIPSAAAGHVQPTVFRALRALRAFRLLRAFHLLRETFSPLSKAFLRVGIALSCFIFIFACFFNLVEDSQLASFGVGAPASPSTFGNSIYLGIVTVATVGYGDVSPNTWAGKLLVVVLVLLATFFVPFQVEVIGGA